MHRLVSAAGSGSAPTFCFSARRARYSDLPSVSDPGTVAANWIVALSCRRALQETHPAPQPIFRIQSTSFLMSASGTAGFGGIGTLPHAPCPPFLTFS